MLTTIIAILLASPSIGEPDELPGSLAEEALAAAFEPDDALPVELTDPQVRPARQPLFGRLELTIFGGAVMYSSSFESKSSISGGGGLMLRVPMPALPTERFGAWGEFEFTHLSRDLTPPRDHMSGNVYAFAVGADFTIYRSDVWYLMAQAGTIYVAYDHIVGVKDGLGGIGGAVLGVHWVKRDTRFAITLNPQWATTGSDWIFLFNLGAEFRF